MGYKEIEIGFPAASQTDFDFVRQLIDERLIPDDVTVQVLTQAREPIDPPHVRRARGRKRAIVHLYNSTSTTQRRVVFGLDRAGISRIAVNGAKLIARVRGRAAPGDRVGVPVFARELHRHRARFRGGDLRRGDDVWQPTPARKVIINLPATVEMATPNVYADQIEWMSPPPRAARCDRAVRASAQRPRLRRRGRRARADGGRGARRGMPLRQRRAHRQRLPRHARAQPVHAGRRSEASISPTSTRSSARSSTCNQLPVHPAPSVRRRPRVHRVFRLAPGRDQEGARRTGRAAVATRQSVLGRAVPADRSGGRRPHLRRGDPRQQPVGQGRRRLPARARLRALAAAPSADRVQPGDPADRRRDRQGAVRGGDPRRVRPRVRRGDDAARATSTIARSTMPTTARVEQLDGAARRRRRRADARRARATVRSTRSCARCATAGGFDIHVQNYHEHCVGAGEDATAVAYVQLRIGAERTVYGVGLDPNIVTATLRAVVSAVNRGDRAGLAGPARIRAAPRGRRRVARTRAPDRSGPSAGRAMRHFVASRARVECAKIASCFEASRSSRPALRGRVRSSCPGLRERIDEHARRIGPGIEITGRITPDYAQILTPEAVAFAAKLQRAFGGRRTELLARRAHAAGRARRGQASRIPARDTRDPRRRLDVRAGAGRHRRPPRRDHRPGRPQDGHQRAQFRRQRVHGGLRGRQHAALGQQHPGPHQPARRDPAADRLHVARGQGVPAEREDRGAVRAAARLAPAGKARADRRRADLGRHLRLRAVLLPQREGAACARHAGRTSTCRSSRATSRRGCGTTSS